MAVNGADLTYPPGWILILIVALVPGLLVAWAVHLSVAATGRRAPSLALVAPVAVLLMMAAIAGVTALADHAYDSRKVIIATPCASAETTVLIGFARYGGDFASPTRQGDGTCAASTIYKSEDGQAVMATLVGQMTADGWTTNDTAWDQKTFTRDGHAVQVQHKWSEEGETAIEFVIIDR